MAQKFHKGDLVHVVKDLGEYMSHFPSDMDAVVVGSYRDQYPQNCARDYVGGYTLQLASGNTVAWYDEHQLILISRAGEHELVGGQA